MAGDRRTSWRSADETDRAPLLADAERLEDHHLSSKRRGIPYEIKYVNIGKGEQFTPEFLAIAPNNRMPAIVDPEGPGRQADLGLRVRRDPHISRTQVRDSSIRRRAEARRGRRMARLAGRQCRPGLRPQQPFPQLRAGEGRPTRIKRFGDEAHRLYGVLNKRLAGRDFVADDYSIADMALIGWIKAYERQGVDIAEFPNVKRWIDAMLARPAVAKAIEIRRDPPLDLSKDKEAQKILFGQRAR